MTNIDILKQAKEGNESAINKIISDSEENIDKLAFKYCKKNKNIDIDDLRQIARVKLYEVINKFEIKNSKEDNFDGYAYVAMDNAIKKYVIKEKVNKSLNEEYDDNKMLTSAKTTDSLDFTEEENNGKMIFWVRIKIILYLIKWKV